MMMMITVTLADSVRLEIIIVVCCVVDVPFVRLGNKSPPPVSKSGRVGSTFSWSV